MTKLKKGQLWKENDSRFTRIVKIIGFENDKVLIQTVEARLPYTTTGRITRASRERFSGKSHGYSLHQEPT